MNNEFEIVQHNQLNYINMLFNKIKYRSPHMHREFEIIYNLGGTTTVTVDMETVLLPPDSFVVCNSNHVHEIKSESPTPFMVCLQIAPEFFKPVYPQIEHLEFESFYPTDFRPSKINSLLLSLSYAYLSPEDGYELHCCALIYEIFAQLLQLLKHHLLTDAQKKVSDERTKRINRIIEFAQTHYAEKICLAHLAAQENLSVTYLSRFIKTNFNRSFQDYIGELRFQQARYLIRHSNKSLLDICEECGYSNYRYLYQTFIDNYNCSPKHYRNRYHAQHALPEGNDSRHMESANTAEIQTSHTNVVGSSEHLLLPREALAMLNSLAGRSVFIVSKAK